MKIILPVIAFAVALITSHDVYSTAMAVGMIWLTIMIGAKNE